ELAPRDLESRRRVARERPRRQLAAEMGDLAGAVLAEIALQAFGEFDGERPVAHHLRDLEAVVQRRRTIARSLEPVESVFSAVEQARLEVVLAEFEQRMLALR